MADITFIKLSVNTFSDEKVQIIEGMPEGKSILIIFLKLLCMAGKSNQNGMVQINEKLGYNCEMLSILLKEKAMIVDLALRVLSEFEMIEILAFNKIELVNWSKHQHVEGLEKVRELNATRQKRYRENNKKVLSSNVTIALQSRYSNGTDIRVENREKDNNNNTPEIFVDVVVDAPLKSYRKGLETNEQHKNDIRENKHEDRIKTFLLTYHINKDYSLRNEIEVFVLEQDLKEPDQRRTIIQFITHLVSWLLKGDKIRHNTEQERKEIQTKMRAKGDGFTK